MKMSFVEIQSQDKLLLPALLYEPSSKTDRIAIFLHGNGDSGVFYKQKMINAIGNELTKSGVALLALNNRGARYRKKLKVADSGAPGEEQQVQAGVHYELIKDCVLDIDGAIDELEKLGYREFHLLGFSTGANKNCAYNELSQNNRVTSYVHAGPGDDSGIFYSMLGAKKFDQALTYAEKYLDDAPMKVMPKYTGMHPFSVQSAYDILHPDAPYNVFPYFEATTKRLGKKPLFKEYGAVTKPQLVIFGEKDEYTYTGGGTQQTLALLESVTHPESRKKSRFEIIEDTDHGFHGKEKELAARIADWMDNVEA